MNRDPKEFALSQIVPYFKDSSLCGIDDNGVMCLYKTDDGRMCVAGKNLSEEGYKQIESSRLLTDSIYSIIENLGQENIFKPEVVGILIKQQWVDLQKLHDIIAQNKAIEEIIVRVNKLGLFTFDELKEYSEKV